VTDTPHHIGKMHDHKVNRVMIYLTKGDIRITGADGKINDQHWKPGDVAWNAAGGMHTSEVVGDAPVRIIEIELKPGEGRKPVATGPLDPVKVDPKRYSVLFENDQVRVLRAKYAAHDKGVLHEHTRDRVTVFLTEADMRVTTPDGKTTTSAGPLGHTSWGQTARHTETNASDGVFEVVAVEMKSR
jgi:hypothetical protein